ncbi:universal stress protein [Flavobacterium sp. HJJ]|uniref:universal stress protein n=1 Tax=Flavobacterium sp. HJJ TaxID=2783792 RepID=UPI00188AB348|nr:universal stress protein [Flavobacterium sp. HJJ]MBF4470949.1 universal stress protein [Flavobacterium sp. HJJ]
MTHPINIIVATNFSETANNAVTYAAGLAKAAGAKLILFNSFSLSIHSANAQISAESMQKQIDKNTERLKVLGNDLSKLFAIEVTTYCSFSFVEDYLKEIIDKTNAELIIMGMAERSLEQDLIGNTTTSVIKNLQIPVLAVPKNARFQNAKKILYACDTLSLTTIKKFSGLYKLVGSLDIEIELFSVEEKLSTLKEEQSEKLLKSIANEDLQEIKYVYKSVRSNTVIDEIHKEIKSYGADILVMVPQKYGFWDSLVHKSKTRIMAAGLEIPLLSYPASQK